MKTMLFGTSAAVLGALTLVTSCRHSEESAHRAPDGGLYGGLVYVADARAEEPAGVVQAVQAVLSAKGVRPIIEGGLGVYCILVREQDVRTAVIAMVEAPELKKWDVRIKEAYLPLARQGEEAGGDRKK